MIKKIFMKISFLSLPRGLAPDTQMFSVLQRRVGQLGQLEGGEAEEEAGVAADLGNHRLQAVRGNHPLHLRTPPKRHKFRLQTFHIFFGKFARSM